MSTRAGRTRASAIGDRVPNDSTRRRAAVGADRGTRRTAEGGSARGAAARPADGPNRGVAAGTEGAEALLAATNAFLRCADLAELGAAITVAIGRTLGASKTSVALLDDDGRLRLAADIGYTDEDRARAAEAIATSAPLVGRALAGLETWSTDPDADLMRERLRAYGAESGFSVPIVSTDRLIGTISVLLDREADFPPDVRQLARNLAGQAALAWELIAARDAHRRSALESDRRGRIATDLLAAAHRLAALTELDDLPVALCGAARDVTGADFAGVARRIERTRGFRQIAGVGFTEETLAMLRDRVVDADEYPFLAAALDPGAPQPDRLADGTWDTGRSRLAVAPIVVGGEVWGVLSLGVPTSDERPTGDWDALADGLASIGGGAIARAEATSELERQRRRSSTLLELSSLLAEIQEPSEIAWLTCDFIRRASRAAFALLGRRDPGGDGFSIAATSGLSETQVGLIDAVLRDTDRPSLRELLGGGTAARHGELAVGAGMGIGEAMGAPIVADGRTIGFLAIGAPTGDEIRPDEWQDLLAAFAAVTATALSRAELIAELATRRDVLASEVEERTRSLRTALDELRVASDAKTDFLANVSHELRTPLTAILGFAEILSSGLDGRLSAEQARDVDTIQTSSRRLLELIDDLIDIASIESGRMQLVVTPVAAEEVIRDAAATIRPLAGEKGIRLEVVEVATAANGGPVRVAADRGRLREILLNLLSNAVKFTPSGGTVEVRLMVEPGHGSADGSAPTSVPSAWIAIRDSGRGIAEEDLERIFEKFIRIAGPATPGTGLGLPISRELARLHGGDLTVASMAGLGSTFTVRIPLAAD